MEGIQAYFYAKEALDLPGAELVAVESWLKRASNIQELKGRESDLQKLNNKYKKLDQREGMINKLIIRAEKTLEQLEMQEKSTKSKFDSLRNLEKDLMQASKESSRRLTDVQDWMWSVSESLQYLASSEIDAIMQDPSNTDLSLIEKLIDWLEKNGEDAGYVADGWRRYYEARAKAAVEAKQLPDWESAIHWWAQAERAGHENAKYHKWACMKGQAVSEAPKGNFSPLISIWAVQTLQQQDRDLAILKALQKFASEERVFIENSGRLQENQADTSGIRIAQNMLENVLGLSDAQDQTSTQPAADDSSAAEFSLYRPVWVEQYKQYVEDMEMDGPEALEHVKLWREVYIDWIEILGLVQPKARLGQLDKGIEMAHWRLEQFAEGEDHDKFGELWNKHRENVGKQI